MARVLAWKLRRPYSCCVPLLIKKIAPEGRTEWGVQASVLVPHPHEPLAVPPRPWLGGRERRRVRPADLLRDVGAGSSCGGRARLNAWRGDRRACPWRRGCAAVRYAHRGGRIARPKAVPRIPSRICGPYWVTGKGGLEGGRLRPVRKDQARRRRLERASRFSGTENAPMRFVS